MFSFKQKSNTNEGQMELMEHLAELRTRIFRALLYVVLGMVLTYGLFPWIYSAVTAPIQSVLMNLPTPGTLNYGSIAQPFLIRFQVAMITGLMVAFPLVTLEMWGFIEPALTPHESKPIKFLAPFSVLLFIMGILVAYACLPMTYQWMSSFANDMPGTSALIDAKDYLTLSVKIMLAFGVAFELPLVLLFLARIGIITAALMQQYWRHAVVIISVVAAIITPSADPFTMLMMAIPMAILYILSIGLVRAFEPKENGESALSITTMLLITMVPVCIVGAVGVYLWKFNPMRIVKSAEKKSEQRQATDSVAGTTPSTIGLDAKLNGLIKEIASLKAEVAALKTEKSHKSDTPLPQTPHVSAPLLKKKTATTAQ